MKVLGSPIWQSVGVLVAVAAIIVSYNIFWLQRPARALEVVVNVETSLIDINEEIADDLELIYKDETVQNLMLLEFVIRNSGNQPFVKSDYQRPITFSVNSKLEIVEAKVVSETPENLDMQLQQLSKYEVMVEPLLVNAGESAVVRFIMVDRGNVNPQVNFLVDGRLVGVSEIKVERREQVEGGSESMVERILTWIFGVSLLMLAVRAVIRLMRWAIGIIGHGMKRRDVNDSA